MKKSKFYIATVAILPIVLLTACSVTIGNEVTSDTANVSSVTEQNELGDYSVDIVSCRLAKDFEGKDIVIVKYKFKNNGDESVSFVFTFDDEVFQNGIGLNDCYFADKSASYSLDNQNKEIQSGAEIEVEAAYELNDTKTKIDVEVSLLISLSDEKITKSFEIA